MTIIVTKKVPPQKEENSLHFPLQVPELGKNIASLSTRKIVQKIHPTSSEFFVRLIRTNQQKTPTGSNCLHALQNVKTPSIVPCSKICWDSSRFSPSEAAAIKEVKKIGFFLSCQLTR